MNNITVEIFTKDYKNTVGVLSGYTLPITPFYFEANYQVAVIPGQGGFSYITTEETPTEYIITETLDTLITEIVNAGIVSNKRVVWDFGDGTYSAELTGIHYYKNPGVYTVNSYFFDATGGVYKNTTTPTITCFNFIQDTFNVDISSSYISSSKYTLSAAKITNPFSITSQSSWQDVISSNNYATTFGLNLLSGTTNYFTQKLDTNKYGHLYPYSSFYDIDDDGLYYQIQDITIERTPIYCALSGDLLYITTSENPVSIFCGVSGVKNVYVKDDKPGDRQIVVYSKNITENNTPPIIFNAQFLPATVAELAFSSNGITGEGAPNTAFDIDSIKYVGQKINFVVTLKDPDYFTVKNFSNLYMGSLTGLPGINILPTRSDGVIDTTLGTISSNFTYLSSITGGYFRGIFVPAVTAENIYLQAITVSTSGQYLALDDTITFLTLDYPLTLLTLDDYSTTDVVSGRSNSFSVYPSGGKYNIAKINEDFDFGGTFNKLRYQEFLFDSPVLFNEFFGTVYGGASAEPTAPGKTIYEKIANFTSNQADVYRSNLQSLLSINAMLDGKANTYETTNFSSPSKIKRLVDIFSINHSRLWGSTNTFNENFDSLFNIDTSIYGTNLGDKLDFYTTVLTSGYDNWIVALERFSNTYIKCNTFISLLSTTTIDAGLSTYALSSYNDTWGWNLVLGAGLTGADITKYYDFYQFINTPEGTHYNNVINFSDPYTTISYSNSSYKDWSKNGGIIDEMLMHTLYTGTNVLSS